MQQQQQPPALNSGSSVSPNAITTEQIQKCLDDNKNLIMAILENQNLGKFQECAQYQAILQKNLMHLAAIADAQPPPPAQQTSNPSPVPPSSIPQQQQQQQQANNYMQQPQQGGGGGGGGVPKLPFQLNALRTQDQQQQLLQFQQQQQQLQAQMGMRSGGQNGMMGMHQAMQSALVGNLMGGSKQDGSEAAASGGGDGQGKPRANRDS